MCSKKWANPDLPGSTSLREPVWTGIWIETMLGKPVGTTMTFRPFGKVFSTARNGITAFDRVAAAVFVVVFRTIFFGAAPVTTAARDAAQTAVRIRDADMKAPSVSSKAVILTARRRRFFRP